MPGPLGDRQPAAPPLGDLLRVVWHCTAGAGTAMTRRRAETVPPNQLHHPKFALVYPILGGDASSSPAIVCDTRRRR